MLKSKGRRIILPGGDRRHGLHVYMEILCALFGNPGLGDRYSESRTGTVLVKVFPLAKASRLVCRVIVLPW